MLVQQQKENMFVGCLNSHLLAIRNEWSWRQSAAFNKQPRAKQAPGWFNVRGMPNSTAFVAGESGLFVTYC